MGQPSTAAAVDGADTGAVKKPRLLVVDMLRGAAALMVYFVHTGYLVPQRPTSSSPSYLLSVASLQGVAGVDVFVVLSGFCLTLPLVRDDGRLRSVRPLAFYRRRLTRLYPAYVAALLLIWGIEQTGAYYGVVAARPSIRQLCLHLVFAQSFSSTTVGAINGPLYSIVLEMELYLVFPLTLLAVRRYGLLPLIAGAVLMSVGGLTLGIPLLGFHLPARYFEFLLGMLAATTMRGPRRRRVTVSAWLLGPSLALGVFGVFADNETLHYLGWGTAAYCGLVLLTCTRLVTGSGRVVTAFAAFGTVSYSFYLLHQPLLLLLGRLVGPVTPDVLYFVAAPAFFAVLVAVGAGFYRLFERPFLVAGGMRAAIRDPD